LYRNLNNDGFHLQIESPRIFGNVDPGICGNSCVVKAFKRDEDRVSIEIEGSVCPYIKRFAELVREITKKDIFRPVSTNPAYIQAQEAKCHPSCPIPVAVLKAAEVAMDMRLPRNVLNADCFSILLRREKIVPWSQ
jgi:hypothetical protein